MELARRGKRACLLATGSLALLIACGGDEAPVEEGGRRPEPGGNGGKSGASGGGGKAGGSGATAGTGGAGFAGGTAGNAGATTTGGSGGAAGNGAGAASGTAGSTAGGGQAGTASGSSGSGGSATCPAGLGVDESRAVFVAVGSSAGGDGTQSNPFDRIQAGIDKAISKGGGTVVVAEGTYVEALVFGGLTPGAGKVPTVVRGGFLRDASGFRQDCGDPVALAGKTILAAPGAIAVTMTNVSDESGLERLTVRTTTPPAATKGSAGGSTIGVIVRGDNASVRLRDSVVQVADASAAVAADPPAPAGNETCTGVGTCETGENGTPGGAGAEGKAGTFGADGSYVPGSGEPGTPGARGKHGTAGGTGPSTSAKNGCTPSTTCGSFALRRCVTQQVAVKGADGTCGCAGEPGAPGVPGKEGGASVGVLVAGKQANVILDGTQVIAGKGGDGSPGTEGGEGGPGTDGAAGAEEMRAGTSCNCNGAACDMTTTCGAISACAATALPVTTPIPGGAAGGKGGKGGKGGRGGDGIGGSSCALVLLGGAVVQKSAATTLTPGQPGKGGGSATMGKASATCLP